MSKKLLITVFVLAGLIAVGSVVRAVMTPASQATFGSVTIASEYYATSTRSFNGTALGNFTVLNTPSGTCSLSCPGTLGSVVITGANTAVFNLYDATTSDATKRASTMGTSTILIASFPTNVAAATYTFDANFQNGLLYEIVSGNAATSTITTRQR